MNDELTKEQQEQLDQILNSVWLKNILAYIAKTTYEAADNTDDESSQCLQQCAAAVRAAQLFCEEWGQ